MEKTTTKKKRVRGVSLSSPAAVRRQIGTLYKETIKGEIPPETALAAGRLLELTLAALAMGKSPLDSEK